MDWFGSALSAALELLCQGTARVLFPLLTSGRVEAEAIVSRSGPWRPFSIYRRNGTIIVGEAYSFLFGLIFWVVVGCIVVILVR